MEVGLSYNKRLSFVGKTRTGKTSLAKELLDKVDKKRKNLQIILIDPKHERRYFGDGSSMDYPKLVTKYHPKIKVQCFQSYHWSLELDNMVDQVLKRGETVVDLDEIGGIATAMSVPEGLERLATQGGGKGVGLWTKYTKPRGIPKVIKSQSEFFFLFRLTPEEDRLDMLNYIPDRRILAKIPKYYFWLFHDDLDEAVFCSPVELKKR